MNGALVFHESDHEFAAPLPAGINDDLLDIEDVPHDTAMDYDDDWMNGVDVSRFARDLAPQFEKMGERSEPSTSSDGSRLFPKPAYSYSCLIALAMKNSTTGQLTVAEIYAFMCEHFPYFRSAPSGWKNSVRHNLSLNKCFTKVEVEHPGQQGRKSCLWMIRPEKAAKMENDIQKWRDKDPLAIEGAMPRPQDLIAIQEGRQGVPQEDRSLRTSHAENSTISMPTSSALRNVLSIRQSSAPTTSQSTHLISTPRPSIDLNNRMREGIHMRIRNDDNEKNTIVKVGNLTTRILPHIRMPQTPRSPVKKMSDLLPLEYMPKLQTTPPKQEIKPHRDDFSLPIRPDDLSPVHVGYSSYEAVNDALTNNSLLVCALDQSPYKGGPITFPSDLGL